MEKVQAGFRGFYRILVFLFLLSWFLVRTTCIKLRYRDYYQRQKVFCKNATFFTGLLCKLYNMKVTVKNLPPKNQIGLVVGNHMGFVDILIMNSLMPTLFVTSVEMQQAPLLGTICEFGGCVFVERRSRQQIGGELKNLVDALKAGLRVCLYPEATSSNGEQVLPFKRTLMSAAALAGVPIIPYSFNFKSIAGDSFKLSNRDKVCWYGDMTFLPAFLSIITIPYIETEVEFLPFDYPKADEERAVVTERVREKIVAKFRPLTVDIQPSASFSEQLHGLPVRQRSDEYDS